jgi:hypothetical protein
MQFLTIASALLSSALVASAAPTSDFNILPRSCSAAYPETIGFPINYVISQDAGATNKRDDNVAFSVPAGSNSCSLEVNFPAGYPITSSGNSQVYVYAVDGPSPGSQVGTVTFKSDPNAATRIFINSFTCQTTMTYRMSIGETAAGSVAFADTAEAGLTMTYC